MDDDNEDNYEDDGWYSILTKEEKDMIEKEEKREREAMANQIKLEQKDRREKKKEKLRQAMARPIDPLPERELCQYEKIREDIIQEREEALAKFCFYEDLYKTKQAIGFYGDGSERVKSTNQDENNEASNKQNTPIQWTHDRSMRKNNYVNH